MTHFERWMQLVDNHCWHIASCSVRDLPDCPFLDWYVDRVAPLTAAKRALKRADF